MAKDRKYNVLIMRDDTKVRSLRVAPFWFKLLFYFFVVLVGIAAGSGYLGFQFWNENRVLESRNRDLASELQEARVNLERLSNVEKILNSNEPEDIQGLVGTLSVEEPPPPPRVDLSALFNRVDLGKAAIQNLNVKQSTERSLRLTFDLNNIGTDNQLSGHVEVSMLTRDGQRLDVETNRDDLSFLIQRYKKIVTTFNLPEGYGLKDVFGLRLTIVSDSGSVLFRETYQISRLLS